MLRDFTREVMPAVELIRNTADTTVEDAAGLTCCAAFAIDMLDIPPDGDAGVWRLAGEVLLRDRATGERAPCAVCRRLPEALMAAEVLRV